MLTGILSMGSAYHYGVYIMRSINGGASSKIAVGDAGGSRVQIHARSFSNNDANSMSSVPINILDLPNTTYSVNYVVYGYAGVATIYMNRTNNDTNAATIEGSRGYSVLIAREIN